MRKKKILLFGNYGGQNWGDECILTGMLSLLPQKRFDITVISSDPKQTKKLHGVNAVFPPPFGIRSLFRGGLRETISAIREADFILFGGGGLLQNREKKAIFLWSFYVRCCTFFRKKILFVANSLGPLNGKSAKKRAKKILKSARFLSFRDLFSQKLASSWGMESKANLATDAIFCLRKAPKAKRRRGTLLCLHGNDVFSLEKIKKILPALPKPVEIISMDQVDKNLTTKITQDLSIKEYVPQNISDLRQKFSNKKLVLSSRLHGVLLALQQETPFFSLSKTDKIQHFLEERKLSDLILGTRWSPQAFIKKLKKFQKEEKKFQKQCTEIRKQEKKQSENILPFFLQ